MNNSYKRIIYAIEHGLGYEGQTVKVEQVYGDVNDKTPLYCHVKLNGSIVTISKRHCYIAVAAWQGANVRLVNVILGYLTHGAWKIAKRGGKYVLKRLSEAPIWHVDLN